eukprot:TRINITY_DN23247_c0_g1_i1.p1 TRINITY_DN23247_c0_g1~~TRINITY_DN23247_c0_g1_i1.p1  ORF type:complete len:231 (-),score=75.25 TRINITY_DN23247_c0_g1_i1:116-808(-)
MLRSLVGSEMCIRDRVSTQSTGVTSDPMHTQGTVLANGVTPCHVFRPTLEEFMDMTEYIKTIELANPTMGICKIIPPDGWFPRKQDYHEVADFVISHPIQQEKHGLGGVFTQLNMSKGPISVRDYKAMAESKEYRTPAHKSYEDLDRIFWRTVQYQAPLYGADAGGHGTLFDADVPWNMTEIKSILSLVEEEMGVTLDGVTTPFMYFGMWKTTFAWHIEDMNLYLSLIHI